MWSAVASEARHRFRPIGRTEQATRPHYQHWLKISDSLNLPAYLPLASEVKPLQVSIFESQVLILLATPSVYRTTNYQQL